MARSKGSLAHPSLVWALLLAAALMAGPSAVAQEAPPLDYDDPCQYMDPVIWAGYCGYGSGGGGGQCRDCVIMNNPYTLDSYCICAKMERGGWLTCNAPKGDPICELCTVDRPCPR